MNETNLWLGSQGTYEAKELAAKLVNDKMQAGMFEDDEDEAGSLLSVQGNVGVVAIEGSLVDGSAGFWGRMFGITGYQDIRDALVEAVANPNVGSILLNMRSGGGEVSGCHETAQLIQRVNKVKPVVTYNGSTMASACAWLGLSARKVFASETAQSGSIGVIMVHASRAQMLKNDGVSVTVIRAGAEKALNSPYEDLSKKAEEILQKQADTLYGIFMNHVADCRGANYEVADAAYGQGRVFYGKEAAEVGLIDAVGNYEDAFSEASKLAAKTQSKVNPKSAFLNNSKVPVMPSANARLVTDNLTIPKGTLMPSQESLTEEQIAAIAAGIDLTPKAATEPTPVPVVAPVPTEVPAVADAALTMLKDMLSTAQAELVTVKAEAMTAKATADAAVANQNAFVEIARSSVKTMGLHFGLTNSTVAAMSAVDVLAEHGRLSVLFKEKFKTGGVAATSDKTGATRAEAKVPASFAAITKKGA